MEKTKKNGILKTAACIFGGTMLMTCVLGGTLAKYASSQETTIDSDVTAAKWDIEVGGNALSELSNLEFTNFGSTGAQAGGVEYTTKPAPGNYGYAEVKIVNKGDVDAVVKIDSTELKTFADSGLTLGLTTTPPNGSDIVGEDLTTTGVTVQAGDDTGKTIYVAYNWEWDEAGTDANDKGDTALAGTTIDFGSITLTAEQAKKS